MQKKIIGVLGGMSPESTANFYQELIKQCRKQYGAKYDKDFPKIFIYNLPIPNIFAKIKSSEKVLKILVNGAKKLESIGVDFIVMPCNTAHYFYGDIKKEISIPFLSITKETAKKIKSKGFDKVGILATGTTIVKKVFSEDIHKFGIKLIVPQEQDKVTSIIDHILTGEKLEKDKKELIQIIEKLKNNGAQAIIIGCTEISLLLKQKDVDIEVFDTAEVLAESTIKYTIKN